MSTHTQSLRRWTLGLGGVTFVLAASMFYIMWNDRQLSEPLDSNSLAQASALRIVRDGFPDIHLSRDGLSWNIDQPCSATANIQRLEPLLGALQPGAHQYTADEVDRQAAGLQTPEAIVYIDDVEFRIGQTDLQGERRYIQHDEVVEFAPEWVLSLINGGLTAFADPTLFLQPVDQLQITDEQGDTRIISSAPELQQWQTLSAQQVVTWPLPDNAITPQNSTQSQVSTASQTYQVYKTEKLTALYAEDAGCAYILAPDSLPTS